MSISHALGDSGARYTFDHEGRTYTVKHLSQRVKAAYEQWLKANVLDSLAVVRRTLGRAEYVKRLDAFVTDAKAGRYGFYTPLAHQSITSPAGAVKLAQLLFDCSPEETSDLIRERGEDVFALVRLIHAEGQAPTSAKASKDGGASHGYSAVVAALVGEPFGLSMAQIADLTDRQISDIYFHKRGRDGTLAAAETHADDIEQTISLARMFGTPEQVKELRERQKQRLLRPAGADADANHHPATDPQGPKA